MDDSFGLTLESSSVDALIERVKTAVPEMLAMNGYKGEIDLSFEIDRIDKLKAVESS